MNHQKVLKIGIKDLANLVYNDKFNPSNKRSFYIRNQQTTTLTNGGGWTEIWTWKLIKDELGHDLTLNYFSEHNLFNFLFLNSSLLNSLELSDFFMQLFLLK